MALTSGAAERLPAWRTSSTLSETAAWADAFEETQLIDSDAQGDANFRVELLFSRVKAD